MEILDFSLVFWIGDNLVDFVLLKPLVTICTSFSVFGVEPLGLSIMSHKGSHFHKLLALNTILNTTSYGHEVGENPSWGPNHCLK